MRLKKEGREVNTMGARRNRQKVGNSKPGKNRRRQKATAKNLASGMSPEATMVEAGYSETYARSHGYAVVKRPYIQSIVTEAVDRVMKEQNKEFDAIVRPPQPEIRFGSTA